MSELSHLINEHTRLTSELAAFLRELGDTRQAIVTNQAHAWNNHAGLSITERREEVRHSAAQLIADTERQLGDIEALRAEIANLTLRIEHHEDTR